MDTLPQPENNSPINPDTFTSIPSDYVTYDKFDPSRVRAAKPEQKSIPVTGTNGKVQQNNQASGGRYWVIPYLQEFTVGQKVVQKDLHLEGCELNSYSGIIKSDKFAKVQYKIQTRLDPSNPEHCKFQECIDQIYHKGAEFIYEYRKMLERPGFNPKSSDLNTTFKHPLFRPIDAETGGPQEGRAATMFITLIKRGKEPYLEETLFTGPDGTKIDWRLLCNAEIKFIPMLHVKQVFIGVVTCVQIEMKSAVITDVKARNSMSMQQHTIQRLRADPVLLETVASQLATLTLSRQDSLLTDTKETETEPEPPAAQEPTVPSVVTHRPHMVYASPAAYTPEQFSNPGYENYMPPTPYMHNFPPQGYNQPMMGTISPQNMGNRK